MHTPTTFAAASAQAAAIPESIEIMLGRGGSASVHRLSWLQFEALWGELAELLASLLGKEDQPQRHRDTEKNEDEPCCFGSSVPLCLCGGKDPLLSALLAAPSSILRLAALSVRQAEVELAQWPPADVLAVAAASLELNFIAPVGVRDFFAAVGRLGG